MLLTALTPVADGRVTVRGVDTAVASRTPSVLDVTSTGGVVSAVGSDEPISQLDVVDQAFRFELDGLDPGAWSVCADSSGVTVQRRVPTPAGADGCGTIVVGDLNVGTTGLVVGVDPVDLRPTTLSS